jgi:hypothetical protein
MTSVKGELTRWLKHSTNPADQANTAGKTGSIISVFDIKIPPCSASERSETWRRCDQISPHDKEDLMKAYSAIVPELAVSQWTMVAVARRRLADV